MVALNPTARSPLHSYRQVAVDVSTLALAAEIDPSFFPAGATYLRRGLCRDDRPLCCGYGLQLAGGSSSPRAFTIRGPFENSLAEIGKETPASGPAMLE
jgi:hypothetical protein